MRGMPPGCGCATMAGLAARNRRRRRCPSEAGANGGRGPGTSPCGRRATSPVAPAWRGAKLRGPGPLRNGLIALLGIMIGSGFTASLLLQAGEWLISLAAIIVYIGVTATIVFAYLRRFGGYDRVTSYFMAMPGGLTEMTAIGLALGGDDRAIALRHAWRILIVVFTIPLSFRLFARYMPSAVPFSGGLA